MKTDLSQKFCIVGTGDFAREVLCCLIDIYRAQGISPEERIVFLNHDGKGVEGKLLGYRVLSNSEFISQDYQVVIGIGNPSIREFVVKDLPEDIRYATIIHPSVVISEWVEIGEGTIITAGCVLTCQIKLGKHTQLNLNTTIGHDTEIGDFFTTATNVSVSGRCHLGSKVYMGSNSAIKQRLSVCSNVTIGMGAAVVKPINIPGTYVGVPAQKT